MKLLKIPMILLLAISVSSLIFFILRSCLSAIAGLFIVMFAVLTIYSICIITYLLIKEKIKNKHK